MNDIREYSGYFIFSELNEVQISYLVKMFVDRGFELDLSRKSLEFQCSGRDDDRIIVDIFKKVAEILKDAEGELKCEIDDEQNDPHFEFFSIKQGKLWFQRGHIVRSEKIVTV